MRAQIAIALGLATVCLAPASLAAAFELEGAAPEGGSDHFFIPFEVPEGIREIEVRHESLGRDNILDFGLYDPNGTRGWGGGNTEAAIVGEEAASRSYLAGPIPKGTWQVVVGKAKIIEKPARYRIEIELRDEPTLEPQSERRPYEPVDALKPGPRYFAGDFHVHSRESGDARPTMDLVLQVAREAGLDFVELAEHNTTSHLDFFGDVQARHPDVLLLPGVEFTTYAGHANGIGATAFVDHKIGQPGVTIEGAARAFREQGALFALNHPALELGDLCIGCAWSHDLPGDLIDAIELGTGGWKQGGSIFTPMVIERWERLTKEGHRIAAIGGSDDHEGGEGRSPIGSPTTMVHASELSVNAIVEGVRQGRTVVKLQGPEDPMIELLANDALPGSTVLGHRIALQARVTGGVGAQLQLVVSGESGEPVEITSDPFVYETSLEAPPAGESFVRAQVLINDHPRTVTNHVFLRRDKDEPASASTEGCGCHVGSRPSTPWASVALASLLVLGRRSWSRRARR